MRCLDANPSWQKLILATLLFIPGIAAAQSTASPTQLPAPQRSPASPTQAPGQSDENDSDPMAHRVIVQQVERRNTQRQQDIVNDTNKLLELAQQLKAEVDKSSKDQMSLAVIKKAEEVEKLARTVKEKMKGN